MEFFATCGRGMEKLLGEELHVAGVHGVRPLTAGVAISGDMEDAYRALLWSRIASRVLLTLGRVRSSDADALYEDVYDIPWEDHIGLHATIAVSAYGTNDALRNSHFTALRVKDAICDRLMSLRGARPSVETAKPDVRINVQVGSKRATVSIDLSGTPLDHRGYRAEGKPVGTPLRENLAAALLAMAGWTHEKAKDSLLVNPFAGAGTIAIEAALIASDAAPGILRPHWGFDRWLGHDPEVWDKLLDEADDRAQSGTPEDVHVLACEADPVAVRYAEMSAKRSGAGACMGFFSDQQILARVAREKLVNAGDAFLACLCPASTSFSQLPTFYASLTSLMRDCGAFSKLAFLSADPNADVSLGYTAATTVGARNGTEDTCARIYDVANAKPRPQAKVKVRDKQVLVGDERAQQFASRLNKVARERRKWAKQKGIYAYRVYDADLNDYNMAIDVYNGAGPDAGRTLIHVAEYAAPKEIDPAKTAQRMADALAIIPVVFEVDPADVFVKRRLRARGGEQYALPMNPSSDAEVPGRSFITCENGLLFEVNLADRLDTGIFLDHRLTRDLIGRVARDKSFLNLFAYTGTASVYAAAGGARYTTTVDMSNTYLDWAWHNMELNGLIDSRQEFERADVLGWIDDVRHSRDRWDLIFVDPPTFSNSSKMGSRSWDVKRDHVELLIGVSRLLTPGGTAIFSCNERSFKPDVAKLRKAGVLISDITAKTIPHDFERNQRVHHCYLLRRESL